MDLSIAIIAGAACGFINTLASSGSALTLPALLLLGLSPADANGTNRLPVFFAALIASFTYIKRGAVDWKLARYIVLPSLTGAVLGVFIADHIPEKAIKTLIVFAVVIALLLLMTNVKNALNAVSNELPRYRLQEAFYLFLTGIWMGLIVLDSATYLLLVFVMAMRLPLLQATTYKNLVLLFGMGLSLVIMSVEGNVNWEIGGYMSLGSILGGYIGARFSFHHLAKIWTYRLLVTMISLEIMHIALTEWLVLNSKI